MRTPWACGSFAQHSGAFVLIIFDALDKLAAQNKVEAELVKLRYFVGMTLDFGSNVILWWPISQAGFSYGGYYLQETVNLGSAGGWITVNDTSLPVVINGQIKVTRPMLGPQISHRLAQ